ncbi:MAG: ABC transporter substrate-binding protein [Aggregatilineales bacterium]
MRLKRILAVVLMLFSIQALVSVAQDDETVVIRGFGNLSSFNPYLASDGASFQAYRLLFPTPFGVNSMTGEPEPGLTSWEISDDGLTYTFTILEDAAWSDGTPISSADMKFAIDAVKSEEIASVSEAAGQTIAEVNIIDEKTYEIVLNAVNCAALSDLGSFSFIPAHKFAADFSDFESSEFNDNPDVSGGPYILEEWEPDAFQRFRANPDFWAGEPAIPFLINRVVGEQAVALQAIQAGEVDYTYFQGDLFQQIPNTDNLQWDIYPQMSVNFLSLNWADPDSPEAAMDEDGNMTEQTPHPIFSDVAVRKAVAMGYNKGDVLATLGGDQGGTPLVGAVNPAVGWAYNNDLEPYAYDPDAAMQILEDAGWVDEDGDGVREKDGVRLAFSITYSDILLFFETTALVAADQLGDIGFEVTLDKVEWANYLSDVYFGQAYDATPMSNSGGTAPPDPNDFMSLLRTDEDVPGSGNNLASYSNPEIDALIEQARSVEGCDPEARGEIYREIQRIAYEDVAYDWTFVPNIWQTANQRIEGFEPGPAWVFYGYTGYVQDWSIGGDE